MSGELPVLSPSDFVAFLNQTLEYAYPNVVIEGELSGLRISKNSWVYFSLKDENSSVDFFGSVLRLPGPLEDGMMLRVSGQPRLHPRYGFSVNFSAINPVGKGSLKKAADLLRVKLEGEGLFSPDRKRLLPEAPTRVGLITAADSAACADFMKVLNERWGGVEVQLIDSLVQGESAPNQLVRAIAYFNKLPKLPEALVIIRGGGSAEDLAAFSDERVVRAVAASRLPTLVAIGHEVDESLAELAADARASTPTAAAIRLFPDKKQVRAELTAMRKLLKQLTNQTIKDSRGLLQDSVKATQSRVEQLISAEKQRLQNAISILGAFNPRSVLARGYALVSKDSRYITTVQAVTPGGKLQIQMRDGTIKAKAENINAQKN